MIQFSLDTNWRLKLTESEAQQYDHKTIDVLITGDIPDGWNWHLYIAKNCYIDLIPLEITPEGLKCTLVRKNLQFSGSYVAQLYASHGNPEDPDKRSSIEHFMIKHSVSGDLKWPEIPTAFTEYVIRAENAAEDAEEAASHYPYINPITLTWMIWDPNLREYVDTGIVAAGDTGMSYAVVDRLPQASEDTMGKIYFVPAQDPTVTNGRDEYVTLEQGGRYYWELVGSASIDVSGKEDIANKVTSISYNPTDVEYPSAKAVRDYVEGSSHFIVSTTNPYTEDASARNKLWVDPSDGTESGGGGGGGGGGCSCPIVVVKNPDELGSYDYDIYFT